MRIEPVVGKASVHHVLFHPSSRLDEVSMPGAWWATGAE